MGLFPLLDKFYGIIIAVVQMCLMIKVFLKWAIWPIGLLMFTWANSFIIRYSSNWQAKIHKRFQFYFVSDITIDMFMKYLSFPKIPVLGTMSLFEKFIVVLAWLFVMITNLYIQKLSYKCHPNFLFQSSILFNFYPVSPSLEHFLQFSEVSTCLTLKYWSSCICRTLRLLTFPSNTS